MDNTNPNDTANDFAAMYESSFTGVGRLEPGQVVETEVVSITDTAVFIHLSGKSEGILDREELVDEDGELTVQVGDRIRVFFLRAKDGELLFTTRITGDEADVSLLENAFKAGIPVEGHVEREIKGGYEVRIGKHRAFCPFSQMGLKRTEESEAYVGTRRQFKIMEFSENGRRVLVSNRAILEAEREAYIASLRESLAVGQDVSVKVLSIREFGAFVDLQGVQALLPISELSRARVKDVSQVLSVGQEVRARILTLDWQNERISLSLKALQADPWDTAAARYPKGSRHPGTVARVTEYGAFVTLEDGLDGLVHVSELRGESPVGSARSVLKPGQRLNVEVLAVDTARNRISLKPAASDEELKEVDAYLKGGDEEDTYNPFAALLKKKKGQ